MVLSSRHLVARALALKLQYRTVGTYGRYRRYRRYCISRIQGGGGYRFPSPSSGRFSGSKRQNTLKSCVKSLIRGSTCPSRLGTTGPGTRRIVTRRPETMETAPRLLFGFYGGCSFVPFEAGGLSSRLCDSTGPQRDFGSFCLRFPTQADIRNPRGGSLDTTSRIEIRACDYSAGLQQGNCRY